MKLKESVEVKSKGDGPQLEITTETAKVVASQAVPRGLDGGTSDITV